MTELTEMQDKLSERLNNKIAQDMDEIFQFVIPDASNYYLTISGGVCTVNEGEVDNPSVTLSLDSETMKSVLEGRFSSMQAFMFGKVKADGDLRLAARLGELFAG